MQMSISSQTSGGSPAGGAADLPPEDLPGRAEAHLDRDRSVAARRGEPSSNLDPEDLSVEQVADLLEQVGQDDIEVAHAELEHLLARIRPTVRIQRVLTCVPPQTLRQATVVMLGRRRQGETGTPA